MRQESVPTHGTIRSDFLRDYLPCVSQGYGATIQDEPRKRKLANLSVAAVNAVESIHHHAIHAGGFLLRYWRSAGAIPRQNRKDQPSQQCNRCNAKRSHIYIACLLAILAQSTPKLQVPGGEDALDFYHAAIH